MGGLVRWGVGALDMLDNAWVRRSLGGHMCEHCEGRNFLGWLGELLAAFPFRVDIKQHSHQSLSPVLDVLSGL